MRRGFSWKGMCAYMPFLFSIIEISEVPKDRGNTDDLFLHAKTTRDFSWKGMCAYMTFLYSIIHFFKDLGGPQGSSHYYLVTRLFISACEDSARFFLERYIRIYALFIFYNTFFRDLGDPQGSPQHHLVTR